MQRKWLWMLLLMIGLAAVLVFLTLRDFRNVAEIQMTSEIDSRGVYPKIDLRNTSSHRFKFWFICTYGTNPNVSSLTDAHVEAMPAGKGGLVKVFIAPGKVIREYHTQDQYCHVIAESYLGAKKYVSRIKWNLDAPATRTSMTDLPVFFGSTIPYK